MAGHCGIASNSSYSCACNSKGKPGRNANHSFSSTGQVRMSCHSDSISRYFIGNHGVYVPTLLLAHGLLKLHAGGLSGAGSHFNINAGRTDSPKMWKWKIAQDCGRLHRTVGSPAVGMGLIMSTRVKSWSIRSVASFPGRSSWEGETAWERG